MENSEFSGSEVVVVAESQISVDVGDDFDSSFSPLESDNDDVVLAFDSMQCNSSHAVVGIIEFEDCFRAEDCFVPDVEVNDEGTFCFKGFCSSGFFPSCICSMVFRLEFVRWFLLRFFDFASRGEIEEGVMLNGSMPSRRPNKRPRAIQKQLDVIGVVSIQPFFGEEERMESERDET
ncbi:hypothetical protein L6452_14976 [Arctium lappa]|uniref:Uncharacterized protein n=1 Tax=Arctium lappa TaxID=4217 RepID=A0ACB9CN31_ARCLA|nr:hypothetical protein L6452_14976 [Arctium lappa]